MNKPKKEINSEMVKEYGLNAGASVVGIASSKDFDLAPDGFKPTDVMEGCLSVIVFGSPLPQEAILNDPIGFIDIRNELNTKMTDIAKNVAKQIKSDGYRTHAITGMSGKWVGGMTYGHISLKHAAELAGLGVISKNYLLTNPIHGNILWFSAVLTDADLTPDERTQYARICENCNICIEACPSKALDDRASFAKKGCTGTMFKKVDNKWEIMCFQCRKVCPYRFGGQMRC